MVNLSLGGIPAGSGPAAHDCCSFTLVRQVAGARPSVGSPPPPPPQVVSFSFPTCALPGMPGVFTWIPHYR